MFWEGRRVFEENKESKWKMKSQNIHVNAFLQDMCLLSGVHDTKKAKIVRTLTYGESNEQAVRESLTGEQWCTAEYCKVNKAITLKSLCVLVALSDRSYSTAVLLLSPVIYLMAGHCSSQVEKDAQWHAHITACWFTECPFDVKKNISIYLLFGMSFIFDICFIFTFPLSLS